jgi:hypothetical protein
VCIQCVSFIFVHVCAPTSRGNRKERNNNNEIMKVLNLKRLRGVRKHPAVASTQQSVMARWSGGRPRLILVTLHKKKQEKKKKKMTDKIARECFLNVDVLCELLQFLHCVCAFSCWN